MKNYFLRLFGYDHTTNLKMLDAIAAADQTGKSVQLLAHLLAAQQVWLCRCKREPAPGGALWPDWPLEDLKTIADSNYKAWTDFLNQTDDFEQQVDYKNSRGESFTNQLTDVLAHLINHGTHHRAQVGQQLKFNADVNLPPTDYIFYIREQQS
ncbi:putative damage-inducible protein DinB [Mucilaginibacter yixingensis]|uniref:Putative damage-inducible protein DinB n=1 Tax=Mucilaginibacter yixingensis TaxID=1295612 RepID=A0A2T5JA31_9SPHI|nr:DinB family protein [Mucilaginibacter yixingensis]PTQ96894.1 putative damage-inducible protein DinB [Mucilaginibacter yixingensis]